MATNTVTKTAPESPLTMPGDHNPAFPVKLEWLSRGGRGDWGAGSGFGNESGQGGGAGGYACRESVLLGDLSDWVIDSDLGLHFQGTEYWTVQAGSDGADGGAGGIPETNSTAFDVAFVGGNGGSRFKANGGEGGKPATPTGDGGDGANGAGDQQSGSCPGDGGDGANCSGEGQSGGAGYLKITYTTV